MAGDSWWSKPFRDKAWDATRAGGRGLRTIVEKPYRVGSGEGLFSGRPAEWLGIFLKWFFGIVIILAFVLFLVFLYMSYRTGTAGTITEKGLVAIDETGSPAVAKYGLLDAWRFIITGGHKSELTSQFVWESEIIENEYNEDLGVKVSDFKKTRSFYYSYDPIQIVGKIEASSLKDETLLNYTCELEDYKGNSRAEPTTYPISREYGKEITTVSCYFDDGFDVEGSKEEESRIAKLKVAYDFKTEANLRFWLLDEELLTSLENNEENPFDYFHINDPGLVRGEESTRGRSTDGPVRIDLEIADTQPLSERVKNGHLNVEINGKSSWGGSINRLNRLEVHVDSDVMELKVDPNYCDFEDTGEIDYHGFNIYRITDYALNNKVNMDCAVLTRLYGLVAEECLRRYKDQIQLGCDFRILDVPEEQKIYYTELFVEADYVYEAEKKEVITVFKREGLGIDVCQGLDKDVCTITNRCKPLYGANENEYLGCEACPESWRYCTNYDNQILCEDDPCNLGPCLFEENSCKSA